MPRKKKSKALVRAEDNVDEQLKRAAQGMAATQVEKREVWDRLGAIAVGEGTYVIGVDRDGTAKYGAPKVEHQLKAAELLIAYAAGRPMMQQAQKPSVEAPDPEEVRKGVVDDVFDQLRRLAEINKQMDLRQLKRADDAQADSGD